MNKLRLTPQQLAFIDTFGYLGFPGLLKDKIETIQKEFEAVWTERGGGMDGPALRVRAAQKSGRRRNEIRRPKNFVHAPLCVRHARLKNSGG